MKRMLSVGKQEMPTDEPPESSRAPTATGFGKVLSSIQGLQQRLDDFSIDEVSRAQAKAYALIQSLDDFQSQLTALAKLKDAIASATAQVGAIPEENIDVISADGLESHPQLRAIVQAGRLIRLHRSLRAAQASIESSTLDLQQGQSDPEFPHREATYSASDTSSLFSRPELKLPPAAGNAEAPIEHSPGAENIQCDTNLAAGASKGVLAPPSSLPAAAVTAAAGARSLQDKNLVVKADFDQRLLNDLIETYGEFAIAPNTAKSVVSPITNLPEALEVAQAPGHLISLQPTPAEPAFVKSIAGAPLGLPAPGKKFARASAPSTVPSIKKQGEIDRQLKRIIKDYGEYDLYSPQKSMNFKMVAIVGFVLLGLILGGFYFLKASPTVPAAIETIPQAATTEIPRGQRRTDVTEPPMSGAPDLKQRDQENWRKP
jgi:hypothetical protein